MVFSTECWDNWTTTCKKKKVTVFTLLTKINSKYIIDLNVKHDTIKLLETMIGENLDDLWLGDDILVTTTN